MSLQAALTAYKSKDFATVRTLIPALLVEYSDSEQVQTMHMLTTESDTEKRDALLKVLALNPNNKYALALQAELAQSTETSPDVDVPAVDPEVRVIEGKTYEMLWDCEFCATKKLLGKTHRYCPHCGSAQATKARYFPADDEKIAVEDHVFVGADKVCGACDTPNAAQAEFCVNCGSPTDGSAESTRLKDQTRTAGERFDAAGDTVKDNSVAQPKSKKRLWSIISAIAVVLIGILTFVFWTQEITLSTQEHAWQRSINIDDFNPRSRADWCDSAPGDAYSLSRSQKVRSHQKVPDGETCSTHRIDKGDGTYQEKQECRTKYRDEPVYDTYCNYKVNRWAYTRTAKAQASDKKAFWPRYTLRCKGKKIGCEREAERIAVYTVRLYNNTDNKKYDCAIDEAIWLKTTEKTRWTMEIGVLMGEARCDTLKALK